MPIYAYRCAACGHVKDVLQKLSDAPLVDCPACGASRFEKQLTAAGFQLKGSGWYVTDFRDGAKNNGGADKKVDGADKPEAPATSAGAAAAPATAAPAPPAGAAAPAPAPAPPPAGSSSST
jgi:putative FmdB family regulatory protein